MMDARNKDNSGGKEKAYKKMLQRNVPEERGNTGIVRLWLKDLLGRVKKE